MEKITFEVIYIYMKTLKFVSFLFLGTRNIISGTFKIGKNNPEIAKEEFESHGFLENHVFLQIHNYF